MLFPADSAKFIAENSNLVTIKSDGIVSLAKEVSCFVKLDFPENIKLNSVSFNKPHFIHKLRFLLCAGSSTSENF